MKLFSKYILIILTLMLNTSIRAQYLISVHELSTNQILKDVELNISYLSKDNKLIGKQKLFSDEKGQINLAYSGKIVINNQNSFFIPSRDTIEITKSGQVIYMSHNQIKLDDFMVLSEPIPTTKNTSVSKVRIISAERIKAQGAFSLNQVLSQEMNIRLSNDNLLGSGMSMQGLGGQNVKILIDGVPLVGRQGGNIDLSQINLANIDHIEIIEGPMSVLYGTDAVGGIINLISKKSKTKTVNTQVQSFVESIGTYNFGANAQLTNKRFYGDLSVNRNFFQGIASDIQPRVSTWKPKEQYNAQASVGYKTDKQEHRLKVGLMQELMLSRGAPIYTPYRIYAFDDYYHTNRNIYSLESHIQHKKSDIKILNSYQTYQRVADNKIRNLLNLEDKDIVGTNGTDTQSYTEILSRAFYTLPVKEKTSLLLGYEYNQDKAVAERIENGQKAITSISGFASADIKASNNWQIKPGFRYTHNSKFGGIVSPALNFKYILNKQTYRFSYARGYRMPGIKELYIYFVNENHNIRPNENLIPEQSHSFNVSQTAKFRLFNINFTSEVTGYYNSINNLINLAITGVQDINNTNPVYQYVNIDKVQTYGGNVQLKYATEFLNLTLGGGVLGNSQYNQQAFLGRNLSPEIMSQASYKLAKLKTSFNLFLKYNGRTRSFYLEQSGEINNTLVQGYATIDISANRNFFNDKISLTVGAKNLTNVTTINFSSPAGAHSSGGLMNIGMGRTYFVSCNFTLSKKVK